VTNPEPEHRLRTELRTIIFGTDTTTGRAFDIVLLVVIVASVANLMLVSVGAIADRVGDALNTLEWIFTIAFTLEYFTRIYAARNRLNYIFSFYGLIDLISILPLYLSFLVTDAHYLIAVRVLRVMRIFRVLKLIRYANDANALTRSLMEARRKLQIFVGMLVLIATVLGALMYIIEGPEQGFTSIPRSIYWAVVTITTVGYGDIVPVTIAGQTIAGIAIVLGFSLVAVTTGIITAELTHEISRTRQQRQCPHCERSGHEIDAHYCKFCGGSLKDDSEEEPEDEEQAEARDKLD